MERTILHCDMNNFYASVECLYNPAIREKPVAVCGNPALRHGIVLAKNGLAKSRGVRTGEALWEAERKCPGLVTVPPHFDRYLRFSAMAREIYAEYTDQVEPFGLDECWLDVTGSAGLYGDGVRIADELRRRVREELGVTISAGVSFNKIFAKLGSDYRKPDATTLFARESWREKVFPLPVGELLGVGGATGARLRRCGIRTIGALAETDPAFLGRLLGKNGVTLWQLANGLDTAPVMTIDALPLVKSIGNSTTTPRDLVTGADVRITLYSLAESVAARLREQGCRCTTVKLHVRDRELASAERQRKLPHPTGASADIADAAFALFHTLYPGEYAVRSLGVQAGGLVTDRVWQTSLRPEMNRTQRAEALDNTVEAIRRRFGHASIGRGLGLRDKELVINPKEEHLIHPVSYRNG